MNQVTVNDIEVRYCSSGAGDPVIFLHGLAEDHHTWRTQLHAPSGFHHYACDLRGHGSTSAGQGEGTLAQLGQDLLAFIQQVTGPAVVVGFSLGGTIALWAAAERPDLIRKAVVLGTSSVVGRSALPFYEDRIAKAADTGSAAFKQAMREDTAAGLFKTHPDLDRIVQARLEAVGDGQGYINAARAMMRVHAEPLTPRLALIKSPVVVVGAEDDKFCPKKAADIMLAALPNAQFLSIPEAGHLMNIDNPDAVSEALGKALGQS